jgi:hypothetical protein
MKKKMFSLLLLPMGLTLFPEDLAAQEKSSKLPKDFRHHEVSVSYGFMPSRVAVSYFVGGLATMLTAGAVRPETTSHYGSFNVGYTYRFNKKFSLGLWAMFCGVNEIQGKGWAEGRSKVPVNRRVVSILPLFRWNWRVRRKSSFYSSIGLGYQYERRFIDGMRRDYNLVSWQLTAVGFEYGTRLVGYAEYGLGDVGALQAGVRWRF